jgi:hypothetical protein
MPAPTLVNVLCIIIDTGGIQQSNILVATRLLQMMLFLVRDISLYRRSGSWTYRKGSVPFLPVELADQRPSWEDPSFMPLLLLKRQTLHRPPFGRR